MDGKSNKQETIKMIRTGILIMALLAGLMLITGLAGAETVNYQYDSAGRLASVDYGGAYFIQYSYDPAGNRTLRWQGGLVSGDINGNETAGLTDLIIVLKLVAGMETGPVAYGGDVNGDGRINLNEAIFLLQTIAAFR